MFEVCGARAGSSAAAAPILPVDCRSERIYVLAIISFLFNHQCIHRRCMPFIHVQTSLTATISMIGDLSQAGRGDSRRELLLVRADGHV
jgi:hypothetical protein